MVGGLAGRRSPLKIPDFGSMRAYEVESMFEAVKNQLATTGLEPDLSLSSKEVVSALTQENNKGDGQLLEVQMTRSWLLA